MTSVTEAPKMWNRYRYQCVKNTSHQDHDTLLGDSRPQPLLNCVQCGGKKGENALHLTSEEPERWGRVWDGQ